MGVCFSSLTHPGGKMIILVTILLGSVTSIPAAPDCSKVATVQLREECTTTQLRVETINPVQQCEDVMVTECEHKFSHFPHRTFSSSRVLGTTSTLVASGVHVNHPFTKREDTLQQTTSEDTEPTHTSSEDTEPSHATNEEPVPHPTSEGGHNCKPVKEKHCQNIPQWKTIPSETCEQKNVTVYVDQCKSSVDLDQIKNSENSPIVGDSTAGSSKYLKIVLPCILLIIASLFLMIWVLSLWLKISFIAAVKFVVEPIRKGLKYVRFA